MLLLSNIISKNLFGGRFLSTSSYMKFNPNNINKPSKTILKLKYLNDLKTNVVTPISAFIINIPIYNVIDYMLDGYKYGFNFLTISYAISSIGMIWFPYKFIKRSINEFRIENDIIKNLDEKNDFNKLYYILPNMKNYLGKFWYEQIMLQYEIEKESINKINHSNFHE